MSEKLKGFSCIFCVIILMSIFFTSCKKNPENNNLDDIQRPNPYEPLEWKLIAACASNNMDMVRLLVENGVDINYVKTNGETALMIAARDGNFELIKFLIENGAEINSPAEEDPASNYQNEKSFAALYEATINGYKEIVEYLVENGADVDVRNYHGETPLMVAAKENYPDIAEYLILHEADVNAQDIDDYTALHWAAERGYISIVRLLIENGADPTLKNYIGYTAFCQAAAGGKNEVIDYFLEIDYDFDPASDEAFLSLSAAAGNKYPDTIKKLEEMGVNISDTSNIYNTALRDAAKYDDNLRVIPYLVEEHNYDVNHKDTRGWTPLMIAAYMCNIKVIEYLYEHGADLNIRNNNDSTALLEAVSIFFEFSNSGYCYDVIEYLVENGADLNIKYRYVNTVLYLAVSHGNIDLVELFLQNGADKTITDDNGKTPLMIAQEKRYERIVELLKSEKDIVTND